MSDKPDFLPFEDDFSRKLIAKFEEMLNSGAQYFYDVEEFELIMEHYMLLDKADFALEVLQIAKSQHPASSNLLFREAEILGNKNQFEEALTILDGIASLESRNPEFYFVKANIQSLSGNPDLAIDTLKELAEFAHTEDLEDTYIALAKEHQEIEMFDEALAYLKMVLDRNPQNEDALYEVGFIFESNQKPDEAIEFYKWFIDNNPYSEHAWFSLGNIYLFNNQLEEAAHAFEYAGLVNNDFAAAFFNLGNCLMKLDRFEGAIDAFESSLEFELLDPITYNYIGHCHLELDQLNKAELAFRISIEKDPEYGDGWLGIAMVLSKQTRYLEGKHYAEKALKVEDDNPSFHYFYADLLWKLGLVSESENAYESAMELGFESAGIYIDYSNVLFENGKVDEAISLISEGIEKHIENGTLYYRYAAFLIKLGHELDAESILYLALEIAPEKINDLFRFCPEAENLDFVIELIENYN